MNPQKFQLREAIKRLHNHDHLCLIYETREEQFEAAIPFIRTGLENGDKCIYIADDNTASDVMDAMRRDGIDVDSNVNAGSLSVITKKDAYLKEGYFDPDRMINFLKENVEVAKAEGYKVLRATGEMTWALGAEIGVERLMEYEAKLHYFFPENDIVAICQYNRNRFSPEVILDVIRTHPLVICGSTVSKNIYYVPPHEFLSTECVSHEVDRLLKDIVKRAKVEDALRISEDRYSMGQEIGHVGNWEYNIQTGEFWGSDEAKLIYGFDLKQDSFSTEEVENCIPERERVHQALVDLIEAGKPYNLEFEIHPRNSTVSKVIASVAELQRDEHGKPLKVEGVIQDITERKRAEEALRESEKQVRRKLDALLSPESDISALELSDIIDSEKVQKLMDEFYQLTHIGIGIIDLHGKVLVGTGWQDICTKFHRVNPESCRLCIESDLELSRGVPVGTFKLYRCKNNMWDIATPIMLGDRHVGNIFLGQFLFDDETPDYEAFRQQARQYGFNEQEYIAALDRVPRWSRKMVDAAMSFYAAFAEMIGNLSYSNIKLANVLEERKQAEEALRESEQRFRSIFDIAGEGILLADPDDNKFYMGNKTICQMLGYERAEIEHLSVRDIHPAEQLPYVLEQFEKQVRGEIVLAVDIPVKRKDGNIFYADIRSSPITLHGKTYLIGVFSDITERKRTEEALCDSVQQWQTTFDAMNECIFLLDSSFTILRCNKASYNICGKSPEELVGRKCWEVVHGTSAPVDWCPVARLQKTLQRESTVAQIGERWIEVYANPLLDSKGIHIGSVHVIADITERKQAEESLRVSEAELHDSYFAQAAINMILSRSFEHIPFDEFLQKSLNMILSVPWISFQPIGSIFLVEDEPDVLVMKAQLNLPEQLQNLCNKVPYGKCLCGRAALTKEIQFADRLDERHDICYEGMPDHGHYAAPILVSGKILGVLNIYLSEGHKRNVKDEEFLRAVADTLAGIIMRNRAEEELRKHRDHLEELVKKRTTELHVVMERMNFLLSSTPAVIYSNKATGDYGATFISENVKAQVGYEPKDFLEDSSFWAKHIHPDDSSRVFSNLNQIFEHDHHVHEYRFLCKDGKYRWIYDESRLIRDNDGKLVEILGSWIDITERKQAETKIKELNITLEQRAFDLEALNKELEAFSYSVSHDLRAPVRHISGFVELLMQNTAQSLDEKSGRYLNIIADSTKHMGNLIDDILSFSRMGHAEMQQRVVKSDQIVKEAIDQMQPDIEGRDIVWDIHPLPEIYGDLSMLKLVWVNLIGNALKYTRTQPHAKIEIGYNEDKDDHIFYIKDNGAGFDMTYVHKLFNIFQRLHRAEEFEGTGVGLANVRRIIQRHGGRTWAEGKVNEGATFYFSLPKAEKRVG